MQTTKIDRASSQAIPNNDLFLVNIINKKQGEARKRTINRQNVQI
jgi:hypothetical protein